MEERREEKSRLEEETNRTSEKWRKKNIITRGKKSLIKKELIGWKQEEGKREEMEAG